VDPGWALRLPDPSLFGPGWGEGDRAGQQKLFSNYPKRSHLSTLTGLIVGLTLAAGQKKKAA
jgi:hypothetical protein